MPPAKKGPAPARKTSAKKTSPKKAAAKKAATRKAVPKKTVAKKAAAGKAPVERAGSKKAAARKPAKPAAASGAFGRAGTAGKAEGDAAVQAWMKGVKPAHRPLVERLDALIGETVPDVKRAIKWSTPMYGREGMGWFAAVASFKEHVRLSFFSGVDLRPPPPEGESKGMRSVSFREPFTLDEKQVRAWVKQASSIQGWGTA